MSLSSWGILIGVGVPFSAYAAVLARRGRVFVDVLVAGLCVVLPALAVNRHHAPWGVAVVAFFALLGSVNLVLGWLQSRQSGAA